MGEPFETMPNGFTIYAALSIGGSEQRVGPRIDKNSQRYQT
jgi:hypothetical protein